MSESSKSSSSVFRKSAFSCEACRKRKVKCNAATPSCSRCSARGETCVYSLTPTLSYTRTLESRVTELEAQLAKLRGEPQAQTQAQAQSQSQEGELNITPKLEEAERQESLESIDDHHQDGGQDDSVSAALARDIEGLKMEDDGRISYHGPTSLFQLPSGVPLENPNPSLSMLNEQNGRKERLINNAWRERAFEQLTTIPEPFNYLLDSHWCWIHPLFNFVYRPAFTRDMKINGPYYSETLLNAVLSHSLRWCKSEPKIARMLDAYDGGAHFFNRAVAGLYDSLKTGHGKITTMQTLLILSAQECGRGNRTQAWLYSGMAFRLVEDLGITIDSRKYSGSVQFSDEEVEIRNRLFWSCYFWDKLVSLYFGRSPIIKDTPVSPPRILLDDTAEIEIWTPHGVVFPEGMHYPPTQAHSTSCFMKMCSLAEILNQILINIYDPVRQSTECQIQNCVREQSANLEKWWNELPPFLKLAVNNLPTFCPPSHIVTLNCIYHTTNILLHRPILCSKKFRSAEDPTTNANHLVQCLSSATSIIALYDLFRRTFGDSHVVLSLAYSLYTASSIFLLEIQALKYASASTLEKLRYCIIALERVKTTNPVISTALDLIETELQKLHINIRETVNPGAQPVPAYFSQSPQTSPSAASSSLDPMQQSHTYTLPPHGAFSITPPPATEQQRQRQQHQQQQQQHQQQQQQQNMFMMDPAALPIPNPPDFSSQDHMYDIAPELFEAFSYIEPVNTNIGTAEFDPSWPTPPGAPGPS